MEAFANKIKEAASRSTEIYCAPLLQPLSNPYEAKDSLIGSGTFVIIGRYKGILTNYHVAEKFLTNQILCVPNPYTGESEKLHFFDYIYLPDFEDGSAPDIAFLILDDLSSIKITKLGKKFWDLDEQMINEEIDQNNRSCVWVMHLNIIEGVEGTRSEFYGAKKIHIHYKNAAPYMVWPSLKDIKEETFEHKGYSILCDTITCPIDTIESTPKKLEGGSGAALWKVVFNSDDAVQGLFLYGVAFRYYPKNNAQFIYCRGPKTLYSGFYPWVKNKLKIQEL